MSCETALFLAQKNKTVTCLKILSELAMDMEMTSSTYLIKKMAENNVEWFTEVTITEMTDSGVKYTDKEGKKGVVEGDTVVLALGMTPLLNIGKDLKGGVSEVYLTGDCEPEMAVTDRPGGIYRAIHSGFRVADRLE